MTVMAISEVRIFSRVIQPTIHHKGWVEIVFDDVNETYTELQLREIIDLTEDDMLPPWLEGFSANGGVFDYDEKYFGIDFMFAVPDAIKSAISTIDFEEKP